MSPAFSYQLSTTTCDDTGSCGPEGQRSTMPARLGFCSAAATCPFGLLHIAFDLHMGIAVPYRPLSTTPARLGFSAAAAMRCLSLSCLLTAASLA